VQLFKDHLGKQDNPQYLLTPKVEMIRIK